MNIATLINNWDDISYSRKIEALFNAASFLKDGEHDDVLWALFGELDLLEQDDYFGTEGLEV